jgi:putative oxidoreductase
MNDNSNWKPWGPTLLRVVVGIIFLAHGWQKVFTFGFHGVVGFFSKLGIPLPGVFGYIIPVVELVGGAALVLGAGTRVAAVLLACDMVGAIAFVHAKNGFFMPMGIEFALTLLAANLSLLLTGAGAASVDGVIAPKTKLAI